MSLLGHNQQADNSKPGWKYYLFVALLFLFLGSLVFLAVKSCNDNGRIEDLK